MSKIMPQTPRYRTSQAVTAMVDCAIKTRIRDRQQTIRIILDTKTGKIQVNDDGAGMVKAELLAATNPVATKAASITLAGACTALGRHASIATSKIGSGAEYMTDLTDSGKGIRVAKKMQDPKRRWHGTMISITDLSVPVYPNQASMLKKRFSMLYEPYLRSGEVVIQINNAICKPQRQGIIPDSTVNISLRGGLVTGHLAILAEKHDVCFGMHLYRDGKVISTFEKFGFMDGRYSHIIGELNLDGIPVGSGGLGNSAEYQGLQDELGEMPELKDMQKRSTDNMFGSVFDYFAGAGSPVRCLGGKNSIPEKTTKYTQRGNLTVQIGPEKGPLYTTEKNADGVTVFINTKNPAFGLVKDPLFLVGLIASEVTVSRQDPKFEYWAKERNKILQEFIADWNADPGSRPQNAKKYGLSRDLLGMHKYLTDRMGSGFQFTALSTLSHRLHTLLGRIVYTIHVKPGGGEDLTGIINTEFADDFYAVNMPSRETIGSLFAIPRIRKIIAVREYSSIRGGTIATPEKAYMDMVNEILTHKILVGEDEIQHVFSALQRFGLLDMAKLKRYANYIKKTKTLEKMLGERLEW